MIIKKKKLRVGIVGCGAIGSGVALRVNKNLKNKCRISALFDIDYKKAKNLEGKLKLNNIVKDSLVHLLKDCDLMVEAVNAKGTLLIIKQALKNKKHVLAMSVGKLINSPSAFKLAQNNQTALLIPSGAIAGIDAIKSASLTKIKKLTLTTRKPLKGFLNNAYLKSKRINLKTIKKETVIFAGSVKDAVKHFPQNINVAATIALACGAPKKLKIKILTSPKYKQNSHEISLEGDFGKLTTRTENKICPDNPKTSYLAVLSGFQTLKQFCSQSFIGT